MSNNLIEDRAFVNSIVGEGTRFNGELDLNGLLRIDGDFTGTITTTGKVLVGKNGRAECTINASTVVIGGAVKGNIYSSERVIVLSSGMIIGNIYTPRLIVEEGVILDGECVIDEEYNKNSEGKQPVSAKADSASESGTSENSENASGGDSFENINEDAGKNYSGNPSDNFNDKQSVVNYNN